MNNGEIECENVHNVDNSPKCCETENNMDNGSVMGSKDDNNELYKSTYKFVTTQKSDDLNRELDFVPTIATKDGNEFVIFDEKPVQNGSLRWNLTVCGHFVGMKMLYNELKYNLMRVWG